MSTPDWERVKSLFQQALDRAPLERAAFVREIGAIDPALQAEVESLLATYEEAGSFGDRPALELLNQLSGGHHRAFGSMGRLVQVGDRLGGYQIHSFLGAGGMGEVYRAHDLQLRRDVAIKVLPAAFVTDPERLARFEREARLLAALNHPHIGAIYGIESVDGTPALVLELVEGETLSGFIARGPLPVADALPIASQMAEALEAAHEKGIIHRDLKPANVKIAPDGRVKVLDFGLAKVAAGGRPDLSPSLTAAVSGVDGGALLGTAAYMSPEQARGQTVDKRADIWAFGCVLYEMLTGRTAFSGQTLSDHIAGILEREPDWHALPAATPPVVRRLLQRCLEKDLRRRLHDIADARIEIDDVLTATPASPTILAMTARGWSDWLERSTAMVLSVVLPATLVGVWILRSRFVDTSTPTRLLTSFVVQPPAAAPMERNLSFDISPDGRQIVYIANERPRTSKLFLRRLDQFESTGMPGTEGAGWHPFFSPDGQSVGFWADGKLKRISVTTGAAPIVVCDVEQWPTRPSWSTDGTIFFRGGVGQGARRVSAEGGQPQPVTTVDRSHETDHHDPVLLPGGRAVLFTIHENSDEELFRIGVQSLATGQRRVLVEAGFAARYVPTGHLVYANGHSLFAVPFNLSRTEVTGPPVKLVDDVATVTREGVAAFSVSATGTLVYAPEPSHSTRTLVWVNRSGGETPLPIPPRDFTNPRVSPDGKRLAYASGDGNRRDIWLYDLVADTSTRLTHEDDNYAPAWTRDGRRLTYTSTRSGVQQLLLQAAEGAGSVTSLVSSRNRLQSGVWTADDRALLYVETPPRDDESDILVRPLDGRSRLLPLIRAPFSASSECCRAAKRHPSLSPDGHWLAFTATETGRTEVYVESFPPSGSRHQVTVEGGREAVWSRDGRELFYRSGRRVFAVPVNTLHGFSAGKPVELFDRPYFVDALTGLDYDVTPDSRLLMVKSSEDEQAPPRTNVVLNWADELARRVPSGR